MVVQMNIECKQDVAMGSVAQSNANKSQLCEGQDHLNAGHTDGANAPLPLWRNANPWVYTTIPCLDHSVIVEQT